MHSLTRNCTQHISSSLQEMLSFSDRIRESRILKLFITIFLGAIVALVFVYYRMNFWIRKGIPHFKPLLLLGNNVFLFFGRVSIYDFITNVYNSFPDARYFGIMAFQTAVAVLRDPELIKEVCVENFYYFVDHQSSVDEK